MGYFSQNKSEHKAVHNSGGGNLAKANVASAAPAKNPAEPASTLGPDMIITGNITCDGAVQIFGRVIGDIQAAHVVIGDGAEVEGNVTAHEIAVNGTFKGTIHGDHVKLKGAAKVDGEIFSKSLTVDENVQFEGISRRLDKPVELRSLSQPAPAANGAPLKPLGANPIPVPVV